MEPIFILLNVLIIALIIMLWHNLKKRKELLTNFEKLLNDHKRLLNDQERLLNDKKVLLRKLEISERSKYKG